MPYPAFKRFPLLLLLLAPAPVRADALSELIDLRSSAWRSPKESPVLDRMNRHTGMAPLRITVHYTDVAKNYERPLTQKLRILFNFAVNVTAGAKKKLWGDIPYHYFIDAHGKLAEVRSVVYMPDSNTYYNRDGHITVVLEGDAEDGVTGEQKRKLFALLKALQEKHRIPTGRIGMHKQFAQTDCPGSAVADAVKQYVRSTADK